MGLIDTTKPVDNKLLDLCIIEIIMSASEDEPLTQNDIRELLKYNYDLNVGRKTVHLHLDALTLSIPAIQYEEKPRGTGDKANDMKTNFWMEREFEESELRALIYSVIFSKHMPTRAKKDLVKKLEDLSSDNLHRKMRNYIPEDTNVAGTYNELFWNLTELSRAIEDKVKASFKYSSYSVDKKIQESKCTYTVSPLGIGVHDDDYYLVATVNGVSNTTGKAMEEHFRAVIEAMETGVVRVDTFRLDRIKGIEVLEEPRERLDVSNSLKLEGVTGNNFTVQEYVKENPSLSSGHTIKAEFRFLEDGQCTISDVIDHFGKSNLIIRDEDGNSTRKNAAYIVNVQANNGDIKSYALRNAANVELLSPASLRDQVFEIISSAYKRMQQSQTQQEGQ